MRARTRTTLGPPFAGEPARVYISWVADAFAAGGSDWVVEPANEVTVTPLESRRVVLSFEVAEVSVKDADLLLVTIGGDVLFVEPGDEVTITP